MARSETLDIAGPTGRLEAILMSPDGPPRASAVVCHAHPLHGGIMHFKAVFRVARGLQRQEVAVLRFNFRGVGRSEGFHDGGRGEQDDVRAAVGEMRRRLPDLPVVLGGFSFGAAMALRVGVAAEPVRALVAVGFPLAMIEDASFLQGCVKPRLFVQGERDEFGDAERMRVFVETLPEPRSLVVVHGGNHFFDGHLDRLEDVVSEWAAGRPWDAQ